MAYHLLGMAELAMIVLACMIIKSDSKKRSRGVKKWYFFAFLLPPAALLFYFLTNKDVEEDEHRFPIQAVAAMLIGIPVYFGFFYASEQKNQLEKQQRAENVAVCTIVSGGAVALDADPLTLSEFTSNVTSGYPTEAKKMILDDKILVIDEPVLISAQDMKNPKPGNDYIFGVLMSGEYAGRFVVTEKKYLEK